MTILMPRTPTASIRGALVVALLLSCAAVPASAQLAAPPAAWELRPYKITLLVALDDAPGIPPRLAEELPERLTKRAASVVGGYWNLTAARAPPELKHRMLTSLSSLTADDLPADSLGGDKLILLAIRGKLDGYRIEARELDCSTRLWNSTVRYDVGQASNIERVAFRAVTSAFAPVARIESVDGQIARLKLRASSLGPRDEDLRRQAERMIYRAVLVGSDTRGATRPGSAEPIAWTLLEPTQTRGAVVTCTLHTGLSGDVIPEYHPERQRWALGIAPTPSSTQLRVVTAGSPPAALEGCEVVDIFSGVAKDGDGRLGMTDRAGIVTLPPSTSPLRILDIRRGARSLARVPLVPGLTEEVTLALPDDRPLLALEAALQEAEDALLDLAVRRKAIESQLAAKETAGDNAAAAALQERLGDLPDTGAILSRLDESLAAANASVKSQLQPRVDALRKLAAAIDGTLAAEANDNSALSVP